MEEKLKAAGQAYGSGFTCSQAVFCAFADELGLDERTAYRIMEGFGGGFGALQEVCGAFSACQRQYEIVRKRRRNFVVFRRGCG